MIYFQAGETHFLKYDYFYFQEVVYGGKNCLANAEISNRKINLESSLMWSLSFRIPGTLISTNTL